MHAWKVSHALYQIVASRQKQVTSWTTWEIQIVRRALRSGHTIIHPVEIILESQVFFIQGASNPHIRFASTICQESLQMVCKLQWVAHEEAKLASFDKDKLQAESKSRVWLMASCVKGPEIPEVSIRERPIPTAWYEKRNELEPRVVTGKKINSKN